MATALTWGACAGLVIAVGLVLFVSARSGLRNTSELVAARATLIVDSVTERVREHLRPAAAQTGFLARRMARGEIDPQDDAQIEHTLALSIAAAPQIGGAVFFAADGGVVRVRRTPDGALDARRDQWHASPEQLERLRLDRRRRDGYWGDVVLTRDRRDAVVNYRSPVWRGERFLGTFGAGVPTSAIGDFLEVVATPHGAVGFVLLGTDEVLAASSLDMRGLSPRVQATLPAVEGVADPVLSRIWHPDTREATGAAPVSAGYEVRIVEVEGDDHVIVYHHVYELGEVPWIVGCHFPSGRIAGELARLQQAFAVALLVLVVAVALTFVAGRAITRPVLRLARAADAVRSGGACAAGRLPASRLREIDVASSAFNEMLAGLEERELIRETFGRFVPESLADAILADHGTLAPRTRVCTTLFTDIVGFSTVSEAMSPQDLIALLNDYFSTVVEPIERHGGVIHQFQGDAILATYNLPIEQPDHAARALRTALEIQRVTEGRAFGPGVRLATRVGVNTGLAVCGTVGAGGRLGFTVHGDEVNLAARIEEMNKRFGTRVLAAQSTVTLAGDTFQCTAMGEIPVRGRKAKVVVYRVDGERETAGTASPARASSRSGGAETTSIGRPGPIM